MKIVVNRQTSGSSVWNQGREPGDELRVVLNIGDIDEDLQSLYVEIAEKTLTDDMTDEVVSNALRQGIWDDVCNR